MKYEITFPGADGMIDQERAARAASQDDKRNPLRHLKPYADGRVADAVAARIEQAEWEDMCQGSIDLVVALVNDMSNVPGWQCALLRAAIRQIHSGEVGRGPYRTLRPVDWRDWSEPTFGHDNEPDRLYMLRTWRG